MEKRQLWGGKGKMHAGSCGTPPHAVRIDPPYLLLIRAVSVEESCGIDSLKMREVAG